MRTTEYKQLYLSETEEILASLNAALVDLEKDPDGGALVDELFRLCHTLKSMAQSMEYHDIAAFTHSMETALSFLKGGKARADQKGMDLLFESVDALSELMEQAKEPRTKKVDVSDLVKRLEKMTSVGPGKDGSSARKGRSESGPEDVPHSLKPDRQEEKAPPRRSSGEVRTVRVPLTQLDGLMDVAGELTVNQIALAQAAAAVENKNLKDAVTRMSRLVSNLQRQIMQIRLVPLEYIFTPYSRMVRDVAVSQGKEVDLLTQGGDLGLDRSIQDQINEPLLHLLKNAVSHGIEQPEEREELGKPRRGRIELVARRDRNQVVIQLADDGRGFDIEEIRRVAPERGIISREELSALSPKQLAMLAAYPGYSQAKKVTQAAGRGVGLGASKIKVESLGGAFDVDTLPGAGTTVTLKLPMTMATIQAMLVEIGEETYCIPLTHVAETMRIPRNRIKSAGHREILAHRDEILPLIRLREILRLDSSKRTEPSSLPVVVVEANSRKLGLVVDALLGQQEAVIKPLTGMLTQIKGISGATVLGSGRVAPIVDVGSLV
jgi:two-component system chemotaxis sensor kinase CheA